jgi:two-component system chemotaxis sensor kinase CheA
MGKAANKTRKKVPKVRLAAAAKRTTRAKSKPAAHLARNKATAAARRVAVNSASSPKNIAAPAPARVELCAECTLRHAAALQAQLVAAVSSADTVIVDASAVNRIDMSGLQLLVAFARREAAAGRCIAWHNPSNALREASARAGLDGILGLAAQGAGGAA